MSKLRWGLLLKWDTAKVNQRELIVDVNRGEYLLTFRWSKFRISTVCGVERFAKKKTKIERILISGDYHWLSNILLAWWLQVESLVGYTGR